MFCPNCGNQCPDGTKFCQSCGTPLTNNQQQNTQPDFNNQQANIISNLIISSLIISSLISNINSQITTNISNRISIGNRCTINRISSTHSIPINSTDIRWVGTNF